LIAFLPTPPNGAIGSLDYSDEEKRRLAKRSRRYCCKTCEIPNIELLPPSPVNGKNKSSSDTDDSKTGRAKISRVPSVDVKHADAGTAPSLSEEKDVAREEAEVKRTEEQMERKGGAVSHANQPTGGSIGRVTAKEEWTSYMVVLLAVLIAVLLVRKYGRYRGWVA